MGADKGDTEKGEVGSVVVLAVAAEVDGHLFGLVGNLLGLDVVGTVDDCAEHWSG